MRKPAKDEFAEERALSETGGGLDRNETAEIVLPCIGEMKEAVKQSIRKRMFGDEVKCVPIEGCLKESEKRLLAARDKHPESRHREYKRYRTMMIKKDPSSATFFPKPDEKYRIPGSKLQQGIQSDTAAADGSPKDPGTFR